ncbi:hypothetical protein LINPERPRIM_LOCUS24164 [Linum perenne]
MATLKRTTFLLGRRSVGASNRMFSSVTRFFGAISLYKISVLVSWRSSFGWEFIPAQFTGLLRMMDFIKMALIVVLKVSLLDGTRETNLLFFNIYSC